MTRRFEFAGRGRSGSTIEQTFTISGNLDKRANGTRLRFSEGGFLPSDRTSRF